MTKKNQMPQANNSSNSIVELSDKDLQQVVGGNNSINVFNYVIVGSDFNPNGNQPLLTAEAPSPIPVFIEIRNPDGSLSFVEVKAG